MVVRLPPAVASAGWAAVFFLLGFVLRDPSFSRSGSSGSNKSEVSLTKSQQCPSDKSAVAVKPTRRRAPARAVVAASLEEDTVWMLQQIPDLCILPYAHADNGTREHAWEAVPNRGREASVYLQFIVDHYDNLPDRTVFLHGHYAPGWHSVNIAEILRHLNWDLHYANVNYNPESEIWAQVADEPGTGEQLNTARTASLLATYGALF